MSNDDKIFAKLDTISVALARVETKQDSQEEKLNEVAKLVDELRTSGCVMGQEHEKRIEKLETRPEKSLSFVSTLISILAALGAFLAWMHKGSHS